MVDAIGWMILGENFRNKLDERVNILRKTVWSICGREQEGFGYGGSVMFWYWRQRVINDHILGTNRSFTLG